MNFLRISSIVLLFVAIFAVGSASAASCSDATLKGVYGSVSSGFGGDGTPRALAPSSPLTAREILAERELRVRTEKS